MITVKECMAVRPKSVLTRELQRAVDNKDISLDDEALLGGGQVTFHKKSNLYRLYSSIGANRYYLGGRRRYTTEGRRFCVVRSTIK